MFLRQATKIKFYRKRIYFKLNNVKTRISVKNDHLNKIHGALSIFIES